MTRKADKLPIMQARPCGDCKACCVVFRVEELQKPAKVACKNLGNIGCAIYSARPSSCRNYQCVWSQGFFGVNQRPDLLGLVVSFSEDENILQQKTGIRLLVIRQVWDGAADTDEAKAFVRDIAKKYLVALVDGSRRTLVGPSDLLEIAYPILAEDSKTYAEVVGASHA